MIKNLEKLDFTPNEAKIFNALLEVGESPTGQIIKKTGMHRNIVYESLDNLVKKKLATVVVKNKKNHYKISNPETLIKEASQKLELAKEVVKLIKQNLNRVTPEISIYEGSSGWQSAYGSQMQRLKPGDSIYTLGAGGDKWVEAMGELFIKFEKLINETKIKNLMIAYEPQRQEIVEHQSQLMRQVRYLPEEFEPPANTEIFTDRVFLQIYTSPVILVEVTCKEVADGYRKHFETLWKIAKD